MGLFPKDSSLPTDQLVRDWITGQYAQGKSAKDIAASLSGAAGVDAIYKLIPPEQRRTVREATTLSAKTRWSDEEKRKNLLERIHSPENRRRRAEASRETHKTHPEIAKNLPLLSQAARRKRRIKAFGEEHKRLQELLENHHTIDQIADIIKSESGISYTTAALRNIARQYFPDLRASDGRRKFRLSNTTEAEEFQKILRMEGIQRCLAVLSGVSPLYADLVARIKGDKDALSLGKIAEKYKSPHKSREKYTREAIRLMQNKIIEDLFYAASQIPQ